MKNNEVFIDTFNTTLPKVSPAGFSLETKVKLPTILEENVGNFCPICEKTIFSNLLEIDGKVYLEKNCCTKELVFLENDVEFFKNFKSNREVEPLVSSPKNYKEWLEENPNYGTTSFFLHITARCNQNCPICYEKFDNYLNPDDNYLNSNAEASLEEIKRVIKNYKSREILITGGEPTLRKDLFEIIKIIKDSGNHPAIITNGLKLEDKNYVKKLKKAGLSSGIGIQFDGFNKAANIKLRGQDFLEKRLKALKNIEEVCNPKRLQLLSVIERGLNEEEMSKIIQFGLENKAINRVNFLALKPPENENKTETTISDLIKIMEREGYFDREYFLEMVKMYRNIYEVTRKIFKGTLLEGCFFKRLPGVFNSIHFKKGITPPQLLFQKEEIEKINKILFKAMSKKSRIASFCVLLKNSSELIKSPLTMLLKEIVFMFKKTTLSPNKLLGVGFYSVCDAKKTFLKSPRCVGMITLLSALPPLAVCISD